MACVWLCPLGVQSHELSKVYKNKWALKFIKERVPTHILTKK